MSSNKNSNKSPKESKKDVPIPQNDISDVQKNYNLILNVIANKLSSQKLSPDIVKSLVNKEIIDKGYKANKFSEFIDSIKKKGSGNMNSQWGVSELENAINKFKQNEKENKTPESKKYEKEQNINQMSEESKNSNNFESSTKEGTITEKSSQSFTDKENTLTRIVYVEKPKGTQLGEQNNILIRITTAQIAKRGFFSTKYIQYHVTTNPFGWAVEREYEDFLWLRTTLQKLYPLSYVPNIPKDQSVERFDEEGVKNRMYLYEKFLNYVSTNPELKNDLFLYHFLSVNNDEKFKDVKKRADKVPNPTKIEDLLSSEGKIMIDWSSDFDGSIKDFGDYRKQSGPILKEVKRLSKRLAIELQHVSNTLNQIGDCMGLLYDLSTSFNKKVRTEKTDLDEIFLSLQRTIKNWGEKVHAQAGSVKKNIACFYKYASYENESFKDMNQKRIKAKEEFLHQEEELLAKKEKLFQQGDTSKWDLDPEKKRQIPRDHLKDNKALAFEVMLYKETQEVRKTKEIYGALNLSTYNEMVEGLKRQWKLHKENFQDFAHQQIEHLTHVHQYLVTARRIPTDKKPGSEIISIRVFAPNPVIAKSKFWFQTRRLNKLKKAQGEILSVSEIFEKSRRTIKTYGIVLRYQSRTAVHNMYKEVRDVSLNGAISQLHMEMSGKHRARHDTIQILRTSVITKSDDVKRPTAAVYMDSKIKFPIVKTIPRSSERRFRTNFKAKRPTTVRK